MPYAVDPNPGEGELATLKRIFAATASGNATVPEDAPIQPPQAFVDNIVTFTGTSALTLAAGQVTFLDGDLLAQNAFAQSQNHPPSFDLSGKEIENLDAILSVLGNTGLGDISVILSGDDMGVPTPDQAGMSGVMQVQLPVTLGQGAFANNDAGALLYIIDALLSESTFNAGGNSFIIGVSDSPTRSEVVAKILELAAEYPPDVNVLDNGSGSLTITISPVPANASLLPLGAAVDFNTGVTGALIAAGQPFLRNASIDNIVNGGGTATVMEYANRIGPQVQMSGAGTGEIPDLILTPNREPLFGLKPEYAQDNSNPKIYWNAAKWHISSDGTVFYESSDDTAEPWDAVFVPVGDGIAPAPTLAFVGSADKEIVTYAP